MISKPCQHLLSVCASIDTEVDCILDCILDRLLCGNKPHAYLLLHFLRSLIFKRNDTFCPCRSCHANKVFYYDQCPCTSSPIGHRQKGMLYPSLTKIALALITFIWTLVLDTITGWLLKDIFIGHDSFAFFIFSEVTNHFP